MDIPRPDATRAQRTRQIPRLELALLMTTLIALAGALFGAYELFVPPASFPTNTPIDIPQDASVGAMARTLHDAGAIRSVFFFRAYARVTLQDRHLASGTYEFDRPLGLARLVYRMHNGLHGITPARVTLTEGMTVDDMAAQLAQAIPGFDTKSFLREASTSEGYLFPDTYFFMPSTTPQEVITRLRERFDERVASASPNVTSSSRSLDDIVIMASILEREAKGLEDKRIVAGILWKRLDSGMPLQVDAPFGYLHSENGYTPTAADLQSSSAYNTYIHMGLPPTAISNPGLEALLAAAFPEQSEYLYYLTGKDGQMHYARTFEEHKRNRALYLD